jgi:hypothetical protein
MESTGGPKTLVCMLVSAAPKGYLCNVLLPLLMFLRSDHKYETPTGHASFWNHIVDAVDFTEDKLKQ